MKDKLEDLAIGTIQEGAGHVLGTVKAIKYLIYSIIGVVVIGATAGIGYILFY